MYEDALKSGVTLKIISATRNFYVQKSIWEDKWTGKRLVEDGQNLALTTPDPVKRALKILEYSSMPGSSRHHWGTDMDLNNLNNDYFEQGEGKKIYDWLTKFAGSYGFCQPYSAGRPYGYKEERWHWSYIPVARPLTDFSKKSLKNEMITGFLGSESAAGIDIVNHYILGINEECK
jgi:LAS superfamily LD-carboxypeptidase LdcB